jgi:hypothetical protein
VKLKRTLLAAIVGVLALVSTAACSEIAPPDAVGIYYAEGQVDGYKFDHCVDPGASDSWIANNSIVWLPDNLRTWNIAPADGDTSTPITVASKPEPNQPSGVQVNVWSQTNLKLNTTCTDGANSPLVKWWENMGRRYKADTEEGWRVMLLNTVVPALEKAKRSVVRSFTADALVAGTVLPEVQEQISDAFAIELKRLTGGDYFCGPTFTRGSAECPPVEVLVKDIDYTDAGIQEARNNKQKALENAAAQVAEAEGRVRAAQAQQSLYSNEVWLQLEIAKLELEKAKACAAAGQCTIVIAPQGTQVHTGQR